MLHNISDCNSSRSRDARQTVHQHRATRLTNLVNEVKGVVEVREEFLAEVVVDWDPHEVRLLYKVWLGA